jgi:hypothetical protein
MSAASASECVQTSVFVNHISLADGADINDHTKTISVGTAPNLLSTIQQH